MFGHGRPPDRVRKFGSELVSSRGRISICVHVVLISVLLIVGNQSARRLVAQRVSRIAPKPSTRLITEKPKGVSEQTIRLRISWGGGQPIKWQGVVTADQSTFSDLSVLGMSSDASASAVLVNGDLRIGHWTESNYGGTDVTMAVTPHSRVKFDLAGEGQSDLRSAGSVAVSELLQDSFAQQLDKTGNQISICRAPGDSIPVSFDRQHLVFSPSEPFELEVGLNHCRHASQAVNMRLKLESDSGPEPSPIWSQKLTYHTDEDGSANPQRLTVPVPPLEGVYRIHIETSTAWQKASLTSRSRTSRDIQFVVIDPDRRAPALNADWQETSGTSIDPTGAGRQKSFDPLASIQRLARNSPSPLKKLGNDRKREFEVAGEPRLELFPSGWTAIPIKFDSLDRPYKIEIQFPSGYPTALGVSLMVSDDEALVPRYGFDAGTQNIASIIDIKAESDGDNGQRHELICWPQAKEGYLLLANRHDSESAIVGNIRLLKGPEQKLEDGANAVRPAGEGEHSPNGASQADNRKMMAYYEIPLFPENFGVQPALDPHTRQPLDDWLYFYQGADRLVRYLKSHSYRGAFITVACDGSTLYPSETLGTSPQHDNGIFFSNSQDPVRKDVLEMLFRMFEREGLTLVPTLALSSPLPGLEQEMATHVDYQGIRPVDYNGAPAPRKLNSQFPIYNPLNQSLQQHVLGAISELSSRYESHVSFDGLAIVCRPDTYTLLPGRQWGYDSETLQRFLNANSVRLPNSVNRQELIRILSGPQQDAWVTWRAREMSQWYRLMRDALRQHHPGATLYIAPVDLYGHDETSSALTPGLHGFIDFTASMKHLGLDAESFASTEGLELLRPHRVSADQTLASNRVSVQLANDRQVHKYFSRANSTGALFTHRAEWVQFSQFQDQRPFGRNQGPIYRLQQMTPAGQWNRQRFLSQLHSADSRLLIDGGWTIPMGQEEALGTFVSVFQSLPDVSFANVECDLDGKIIPPSSLPVIVRQTQHRDQSYFYAVNPTPWPIKLQLAVSRGKKPRQQARVRELGESVDSSKHFSVVHQGSERLIELEMPPLSLRAGVGDADLRFESYRFELPRNAADQIRKQVYSLQANLVRATEASPLPILENADFESKGREPLQGWESSQRGSGVRVDAKNAYHGNSCVNLESTGETVWIRSHAISPPETGRLSIAVWLRTDNPDQAPPLRLAVEGKHGELNYYRFGSVGSLSSDPQANQLTDQWQRFVVHFDDVPTTQVSNLRIGFDLMGAGSVHLDQVEIYDRWFDEHDAKAMTQLLAGCGPLMSDPLTLESCRQLLNGYWPRFLDEYFRDDQLAGDKTKSKPDTPEKGANREARGSQDATKNAESADSHDRRWLKRLRRFGSNRGTVR